MSAIPATPLVITATPTLFHEDESLNVEATRAHLTWLHERGVDALFPVGTSGEFTSLSDEERLTVLKIALEIFPADAVYVHVGAATAHQAERLVRDAVAAGATRMAAVTPFYQPAPEDQVVEYYRRLVAAADGRALVFAYLFEARTSTVSRPEILGRLAEVGVAGVKLSGESDASVQAYLEAAPEGFAVFSGNDVSFGWLIQAGGHGIVSGVSSAYPEAFSGLRDALIAEDSSAISAGQARVEEAVSAVRAGSLTHLKAGITARGFAAGPVRTAVAPTSANDRAGIEALAARYAAEA
ncbi:dihydrodipicolinate synthase family protein [Mycetocola tolaasinivorans]|uniref:Dihydrodipicolinate synthase family protein n=1 Tax=Mycetocola tolaasinivorans TaxID=76635 RepID=A0A3L7AAM5_9MICO|nr:dihydrodipicolinate synthase family protein [Mycetocola tolaasinivorans]RLP77247.1 dihydrodipicolinate synthase family protein [Mycetocola tolaasinivorans]